MSDAKFRFLLVVTLPFLFLFNSNADNKKQDGAALIQRARSVSDIRHSGTAYGIKATFTLMGIASEPVPGHLELFHSAEGRWRREVSIPNYFREIDTQGAGVVYKDRTSDYEPLRVGQLYGLIRAAEAPSEPDGMDFEKVHRNGTQDCVDVRFQHRGLGKWCVDATSGVLENVEYETWGMELSGYQKVGEKTVPTVARYFFRKHLVVEAHLVWDAAPKFADDLFNQLPGSVDWPACENMVAPKLDHVVEPEYPRLTPGATGDDADVVVWAVVAADGKVRIPYVIGPAGHAFDVEAIRAVRQWSFHPARCGDKDVPVEMQIWVHFKYGRGGPALPMYR